MVPEPPSVPGSAPVATAIDLIRQHGLSGLPVVEFDRVIGIVTPLHLLRQPLYRPVAQVMAREVVPANVDLPLTEAYELLKRQRLDALPVVREGLLVGLISLTAILQARSQQQDPLTGLPWAPALRTWAMAALERGHEVAMLFIDLDNFGTINKARGHVLGDDILRAVAYLLASLVDPATDFLARYGGDEFAIATTRRDEEGRALAQRIHGAVNLPVEVGGVVQRVTGSVGFAGGRRDERRVASHLASTVEELLTLASRGSTLAKELTEGIVHHRRRGEEQLQQLALYLPQVPEARLRLRQVAVDAKPEASTAIVELGLGHRVVTGTASEGPLTREAPFLVADAMLQAIATAMGEKYTFKLHNLVLMPSEGATIAVAVLAEGSGMPVRLVGSARALDPNEAVSKAVLSALNRRLARAVADLVLS